MFPYIRRTACNKALIYSEGKLRTAVLTFALAFFTALSAADAPRVLVVEINSVIEPVTSEIVSRALTQAAAEHDSLVIVKMDTPGGLMDSMRQIMSSIEASPVP